MITFGLTEQDKVIMSRKEEQIVKRMGTTQ
jgi:hypothetical protein